jgi:hypothetical protein
VGTELEVKVTRRVMGKYDYIRRTATLSMRIIPVWLWLWYGFGRDDWRGGTVVASIVALGFWAVQAVTLIADRMYAGLLTLGIQAILPIACLVWAFGNGWAWLWTTGWILAGIMICQTAVAEILMRSNESPYQKAADLLGGTTAVQELLRFVRWGGAAGAWGTLVLLDLGAPKLSWVPMAVLWVASSLVAGVCMVILHRKMRRRGVPPI